MAATLRDLIAREEGVFAPLALNPLMARLAESAGFEALYLGGGQLGYEQAVLEANLNVTDVTQRGLAIRAVTELPLILDGATGFGDPMHMHRTIPMAEASGFAAIEIEDQLIPKRAHHHVGIEHMIPLELMAAKVREAVAARRAEDFVIIARTNGIRASDLDDAIARANAYLDAGADLVMLGPRSADHLRAIADRVPPPYMMIVPPAGLGRFGLTRAEVAALGFHLLVDASQPALAAFKAWRDTYAGYRDDLASTALAAGEAAALSSALNEAVDIERLLAIERATVEREG